MNMATTAVSYENIIKKKNKQNDALAVSKSKPWTFKNDRPNLAKQWNGAGR